MRWSPCDEEEVVHFKTGARKRLAHQLQQAAQVLKIERLIYDRMSAGRRKAAQFPSAIDVQEIYGGYAEISFQADRYGLRTG